MRNETAVSDTVGNRLKRARLKRGLTFEEAYSDLKIHPHVLESLEEDRINPKIGDIYIKGFVKKYADFLGFDGDSVLSEFMGSPVLKNTADKEGFIDSEKQNKHLPLIIKNRFQHSMLPVATAIAVIFIVFIIAYAGMKLISEFKKFVKPKAASAEKAAKAAPVKTAAAKKQTAVPPKNSVEKAPSTLPAPVVISGPLVLRAETTDKVWLSVKADGKVIFENTLPQGSIENWQAAENLEIWVGRADALDLTLNGKHLGSPGSGRIRKIIFDHRGMRIEKK